MWGRNRRKADPLEDIDVERLRLQPGDVVLLKVSQPVTEELARRIRHQFADLVPNNRIAVIDSGVDVSVLAFEELTDLQRQALADEVAGALGPRVASYSPPPGRGAEIPGPSPLID